MAYKLHNFQAKSKLYAEQLNEMDTQILENAMNISRYSTEMVDNKINSLSLRCDGEYIMLYFGDTLVGQAAIGSVQGLILCEDLQITSSMAVTAFIGDTSKITTRVSPIDTNQSIRFLSKDLNVCSVTSEGDITGLAVGKTTVQVMCGKFVKEVEVSVARKFAFDAYKSNWQFTSWVNVAANKQGVLSVVGSDTQTNRVCVFPKQESTNNLIVRQGQKVTVNVIDGYAGYIQQVAVCPLDEATVWGENWSGYPCVGNPNFAPRYIIDGSDETQKVTQGQSFEFVAEDSDYYVILLIGGFKRNDDTYGVTDSVTIAEIERAVEIIVTPAE